MAVHRSKTVLDEMFVEEAMHRGVVSCPYETTLSTVAHIMATRKVHCVVGFGDLTEDDTQLWGLVSDRDVVAAAAAGDEARRTAGDSAATEILTVGPGETLRRAAQLMTEHDLSHLIVVDPGSGRPVGVLSTLDIARVVGGATRDHYRHGGSRVDELMTTPVISVRPEVPLKEVAALLLKRGISGVPVVRGNEVVGVLSEADIVRAEAGPPPEQNRAVSQLPGAETSQALATLTAGKVMSSPAVTIEPWQAAASAAALMTAKGVKRLPVVSEGALVGIISRRDLVRAYARSDVELWRDIRDSVILDNLWIDPAAITVDVHDGVVTLTGNVEREHEAELLPRQVQQVPGVVSVVARLAVREQIGEPTRFRTEAGR
jgi:CBS domain-containing protein